MYPQVREKRGPVQDCRPSATTVISTDNIDFPHSYAQVFCGKQTSSWHGTTVQAVQPVLENDLGSPMHMGEEIQQHTCTNTCRSTCGESTATSLTCASSNPRHSECVVAYPSLTSAKIKRVAGIRSPCSSLFKSCRSPKPKVRRRVREQEQD